MKIFAQLYDAHPVEPIILLKEYRNVVWKNVSIREKMHEPYICKSNYAILLAAAGQIRKALLFLKDIVDEKKENSYSIYDKYLLYTNLAALEFLNGNSVNAIKIESECSDWIDQIPIFSSPLLQKRHELVLHIYHNESKDYINDVIKVLLPTSTLSSGYCSDNYNRLMLFSDINYWAD